MEMTAEDSLCAGMVTLSLASTILLGTLFFSPDNKSRCKEPKPEKNDNHCAVASYQAPVPTMLQRN